MKYWTLSSMNTLISLTIQGKEKSSYYYGGENEHGQYVSIPLP
jgi:hypothetical protein